MKTKILTTAARVLMGLMFFVFGLNGFLRFIPEPKTPMGDAAAAFVGAVVQTGYMFPLVAGTQLLVGVLLLLNLFVPLALALIAPIIVGIITFHVFLAPAAIAPAIIVAILEAYLAGRAGTRTTRCLPYGSIHMSTSVDLLQCQ